MFDFIEQGLKDKALTIYLRNKLYARTDFMRSEIITKKIRFDDQPPADTVWIYLYFDKWGRHKESGEARVDFPIESLQDR